MGRKSQFQLVSWAGAINGFMILILLILQALRSSKHARKLAPQSRGLFRLRLKEPTLSILLLLRFCYHDRLAIAGNCRYAHYTPLERTDTEQV